VSKLHFLIQCAWCKKEKDSNGKWVSTNLAKRIPRDRVSHGLCHKCASTHFSPAAIQLAFVD
jgi:hypothetical protein